MSTKPPEKELSSQLRSENERIKGDLNNAQSFPTSFLPFVSQKEVLRTLRVEALEIFNRLLSFVEAKKKIQVWVTSSK